ncbi:hypothetical protein PG996_015362 [Apiospora saccharicola]|uniref:Uncharacterized protein n=1 Tax=Apiospora saccharicola TaxID=335842 RepID=A0ABR1TNQ3_9PEZI
MPYCHDHVKTGNSIALLQHILAAFQSLDIYAAPLAEEAEEVAGKTMGKNCYGSSSHDAGAATEVRVKTWSCCGINPHTRLTCNANNDERYQSCYDRHEIWAQCRSGQWATRVKEYYREQ